MHPVPLRDYLTRVAAWKRAPIDLRKTVTTRDERGRPCKELWAHGKCYTRIVSIGGGYCELYADKGGRVPLDYGKISFKTWTDPEVTEGNPRLPWKQDYPMLPRRY